MPLVAGVDSSTQSCKVLICDAASGQIVRSGHAPHPPGTSVNPEAWWQALQMALTQAGGLEDVAAVSIAGQQHGMVLLDKRGEVVRDALLWNDVRSASSARDLIADLETAEVSGEQQWAERTGLVPVASFTASKLRWVADNEKELMERAAAVCLPHDWLSWKLAGLTDIEKLKTDRSDASGTAYFSPSTGQYEIDLLMLATRGHDLLLPEVIGFSDTAYKVEALTIGAGMGDNAAAALGVGMSEGDVLVSVGTSAVVTALDSKASHDASGIVAGFASSMSNLFLPLACTLNGAELFDRYAKLFSVSLDELSELALRAEPGAAGIVTIPFFNGERTPNLPHATAQMLGLTATNFTKENVARSLFEGLLCGLAVAIEKISESGSEKIYLIGGAAKSKALRELAPQIFGRSVIVPKPGEYVALGAAKQAAASIGLDYSRWAVMESEELLGQPQPWLLARYQEAVEKLVESINNSV